MKIAVLADVHGNLWALEAVLNDIASLGVDRIVNLGDVCYGPLAPAETLSRVFEVSDIVVRGNQDRLLAEATAERRAANPTLEFTISEVGPAGADRLLHLPETDVICEDVLCCHGSPASDTDYLLEDISTGIPRLRDYGGIARDLGETSHKVVLCGHTHLPRVVPLSGGCLVVNPGSVGLPAYADDLPCPHVMETGSPEAVYAILDDEGGAWSADIRSVAYDTAAAAAARSRGREDWARSLETGRAAHPRARRR